MLKDSSSGFSIGVDLGGTNLRIAAWTVRDGLLETIHLPTRLDAGRLAVVDDLCGAVRRLYEKYSPQHALAGIGIGTPGPIELPAGRLHNPPNLPGWDRFDLKDEVERRLGMPVVLESDANAAALAECVLGLGRSLGVDSLCMLTLGTGIGNGIILDGKIWHGVTGMGGEAGHMTIYPDGPDCGCGGKGCMEMYASATAIVRTANQRVAAGKAPGLAGRKTGHAWWTARDLGEAARSGDPDARAIFEEAGRAIGIGLAGLVNTLNLPLYVIGGGLVASWDLFAPELFRELRHRSYVYRLTEPGAVASASIPGGGTQVLAAELGSDAGLLGACILPFPASSSPSANGAPCD
ncbi:ROK family protein [Paracidobacterium acidisoli]|uniref:ROK family protein n=1 Tax=Paracidobacterium acidisoli TaxID=2303751 RepID=A0A372IRS0_9BACT|nr:ROK family protein [Paracidobacterium acidisoli]MBT9330517.1 ROK family protein [Paracidobacterium acidisoli]